MKLKHLSLILLLFTWASSYAQIRIGLRAGLSSSSLNGKEVVQNNFEYRTVTDQKVGFHAGLFMQLLFNTTYVQPEFLLSSTGGEIQMRDYISGEAKVLNQRFTKLDIPLIIGKKFGPIRLGVGPIASIILSKPADAINFSNTSIERKYNDATLGYQLDMGLDISSFAIDLKYEGNLTKLGSEVNLGGVEKRFNSRNRQWLLSFGIFF